MSVVNGVEKWNDVEKRVEEYFKFRCLFLKQYPGTFIKIPGNFEKTVFQLWMNFKNFVIEFHTGNKSAMSRRNAQDESFNYFGPVHTLDEVHPYIMLAHFQAFYTMNLFKTIKPSTYVYYWM